MSSPFDNLKDWRHESNVAIELLDNGAFGDGKGILGESGSYDGVISCPSGTSSCGRMKIKTLTASEDPSEFAGYRNFVLGFGEPLDGKRKETAYVVETTKTINYAGKFSIGMWA